MSQIRKGRSSIHDGETLWTTERTLNQVTDRRAALPVKFLLGIQTVEMPSGKIICRDDEIGLSVRDGTSERDQWRQTVVSMSSSNAARLSEGVKLGAYSLNLAPCACQGHGQPSGRVPARRRNHQDCWLHCCPSPRAAPLRVSLCFVGMDFVLQVSIKLSFWKEIGSRAESEVNQLSPLADRLVGCFQHLDHAKASFAVVHWGFILGDAFDEVG